MSHYELAAGRDPLPFIEAVETFAHKGGMLPEQLWDADDLPEGKMKRGGPTGSRFGARIVFTFLWQERWEGKDVQVGIDGSIPIRETA